MKKVFLVAMVLALMGCADNTAVTDMPNQAAEVTAEPEAVEEVTAEEVLVEVTADELLAAYKVNELAADQQFKGKTLLVTGVLSSIESGFGDSPYLMLKAGDEFDFSMPQAHFDKSETDSLVALKKGESITIQCVSNGEMMGSPILKSCTIV